MQPGQARGPEPGTMPPRWACDPPSIKPPVSCPPTHHPNHSATTLSQDLLLYPLVHPTQTSTRSSTSFVELVCLHHNFYTIWYFCHCVLSSVVLLFAIPCFCICVFSHFYLSAFIYLCIYVFVYLCSCVSALCIVCVLSPCRLLSCSFPFTD